MLLAGAVTALAVVGVGSSAVGCSSGDGVTVVSGDYDDTEDGSAGDRSDSGRTRQDSSFGVGGSGGEVSETGGTAGEGGNEDPDASDAGDQTDANEQEDVTLDINFSYDSFVSDGALNQDSACAGETIQAPPTPLDMYIMLDRSGSMVEPGYTWDWVGGSNPITIDGGDCNYNPSVPALNSRWCASVYALAGYFSSPSSKGNRVALHYYPVVYPQPADQCSNTAYTKLATPSVPYTQLPGGATTLINSLNNATPLGANTPTRAALHGLAEYTRNNKTAGRKSIAILITDGIPNSCGEYGQSESAAAQETAKIAQNHYTSTQIPTYVVGMVGANYDVLEVIAAPAGAPQHSQYCPPGKPTCYSYDVGQGNSDVFINVLKQIQKNAIACTYDIPKASSGVVDPNKIEVQYTPSSGSPIKLTKVSGSGACVVNGWYLSNDSPKKIVLCPQTCDKAKADENAQIQILVGCEGA